MTCCKLFDGQYGCCPFENASCCSDGKIIVHSRTQISLFLNRQALLSARLEMWCGARKMHQRYCNTFGSNNYCRWWGCQVQHLSRSGSQVCSISNVLSTCRWQLWLLSFQRCCLLQGWTTLLSIRLVAALIILFYFLSWFWYWFFRDAMWCETWSMLEKSRLQVLAIFWTVSRLRYCQKSCW